MRTVDPLHVDEDVVAAVDRVLATMLERRLEEAVTLDPLFATDVAGRVARFTLQGGRRMRPQLCWWGMRAAGGGASRTEAALGVASALELVQTCALIQDDVMDGSPLRRGGPTVHVELDEQYATQRRDRPCGTFGGAGAVLAGDLALVWADDAFAEATAGSSVAVPGAAVWRSLRTEMVAGQYLDLHAQATADWSSARAVRSAVLKTALYSVERPLVLGATLAGASADVLAALGKAGRCAGVAFQLHDDLQDAFGDPVSTGKPVGEDLREGRPTYLVAVARERCEAAGDRAGTRVLDEVVGARCEAAEADVRRAREVLDASGAREQVAAQVERLCHRSEEVLAGAPLERAAAARLVRLLRGACGRTGDGERSRAVASAAEPGLGTVAAFDDMPAGGPR
ncbi:polyprenyl synthetase family protein [Streptomyces zaomyceticus]|uniref:Polyprenyl synthetase family protein n=1 Tax=Streptomyces zaomyceticus TaxID=68286 RepID=A0ABZ1L097_9ACTN|nr:polyprenyl synthetase family protein [Streptomyces zaomyceticus]